MDFDTESSKFAADNKNFGDKDELAFSEDCETAVVEVNKNENNSCYDEDQGSLKTGLLDQDTVENDIVNCKQSFSEDLYITVSDPSKHVHNMETFILYKVTTKTTRSSFDSSEFIVHRRYQDFVGLREILEDEFPVLIIPPLPSKFMVKGFLSRFDADFVETRCRALLKFIQRIADHPVISFSEHLKYFLTSDNFTSFVKQNILSLVGDTLKWNRVNNLKFDSIGDSVALFGEKMGVLDRIGERLLDEDFKLITDYHNLSNALTAWSSFEDDLTEEIMMTFSNCLEECADNGERNRSTYRNEVIPTVKEYALYSDVVKQTLKHRDIYQLDFEKCCVELSLKEEEKNNLPKANQSYSFGALMGKSPENVLQEKEVKFIQKIISLSQLQEKLSNELEQANATLTADLERWNKCKVLDLASIFSTLATAQISFHNKCGSAWKNILSYMELPEQSPSSNPIDSSLPI